ncbi:MAG: hypothetical protein FGM39_09395 [Phycisphaerales bacterium]|nr:hypothetical protein [Phycisphaerales bacterium]
MDIAAPTRPTQRSLPPAPPEGPAVSSPLKLSGTVALRDVPSDDPRLQALSRACALLEALEAEAKALDRRLADANRVDPMRHVRGQTSLEAAMAETRTMVRELDDLLCTAAEDARRQAGRTQPKGSR